MKRSLERYQQVQNMARLIQLEHLMLVAEPLLVDLVSCFFRVTF